MVPLRWEQCCQGFNVFAVICLLLIVLVGCADNSESLGRASQEVGSISFSIIVRDEDSPDMEISRFTCGTRDDEVSTVTAQITNGAHTITLEEPWDCWDHHGELKDVPVGENYTLTVNGRNDDDQTTYCAQESGITVNRGPNDIGTIVAETFAVAHRQAPLPRASDVSADNLTFSWDLTPGAKSYNLVISESADLSDPTIDASITGLSHTITNGQLQPGTQYYWVLYPLDCEGTHGYFSDDMVQSFTTSDGPHTDDNYEENDDTLTAYNITNNQGSLLSDIAGRGIVTSDDNVDVYSIDIDDGVEWVYIDCYYTYADGWITITLLDGLTILDTAITNTDDERIEFDFSSYGGGTFYILVVLVVPDDIEAPISNTYDLRWDGSSNDDNYEENDTLETAYDITDNRGSNLSEIDGPGVVISDDREDYYRIDLSPAAETVTIDCEHTYADGDIDIFLLNADGTELDGSESATDNESITFDLSSYGGSTFYIKVLLYDGSLSNTYDLWWDETLDSTALLLGSWYFEYTLGTSNFTNTYCLNEISSDLSTQGTPIVYGTDEYGGPASAAYRPDDEDWEIFDEGSIIDRLFIFYTDGSDILSGSCYYQYSIEYDSWSDCYVLGGWKISEQCP